MPRARTSNPYPSAPREGSNSPWGHVESVQTIAPGIVNVTTPGHGGIWVAPELRSHIRPELRAWAARWSGSEAWYEEDCCWAAVAVTWPGLFPAEYQNMAASLALEYGSRELAARP